MSMITTIAEGGCYWKAVDIRQGHSLSIPNGTRFQIHIQGTNSRILVSGVCRDGCYVVLEGAHAGTRFPTASAAVNAVREPSTNAYLYIDFEIGSMWENAHDMRRSPKFRSNPVEELALDLAREYLTKHAKKALQGKEHTEVLRAAAKLVLQVPDLMQEAKLRIDAVARMKDIRLDQVILQVKQTPSNERPT